MNGIAFLLDENLPIDLADALPRVEPAIEFYAVGDALAPPKGTPDPQLLLFAEEHRLILVTLDKISMPVHVQDHWAAEHHTSGVIILKPKVSTGQIADVLLMVWAASTPDEWRDRIEWLPW